MSDLLDEWCKNYFGHTDWIMDFEDGNVIVTFFKTPREDYIPEDDENE